jgi:hypothetical protein
MKKSTKESRLCDMIDVLFKQLPIEFQRPTGASKNRLEDVENKYNCIFKYLILAEAHRNNLRDLIDYVTKD